MALVDSLFTLSLQEGSCGEGSWDSGKGQALPSAPPQGWIDVRGRLSFSWTHNSISKCHGGMCALVETLGECLCGEGTFDP